MLGEVDEVSSYADASVIEGGDQHPELAGVIGDLMHVDAADDVSVSGGGDGELSGGDEFGDLGGCGARGAITPEPAFSGGVDAVDESVQLIDEPGVTAG